jgi:hypothetical protein
VYQSSCLPLSCWVNQRLVNGLVEKQETATALGVQATCIYRNHLTFDSISHFDYVTSTYQI